MRIVSAILPTEIEIKSDKVTTVVIENQRLFLRALKDLYMATQNNVSPIILSKDNDIQKTTQWIELITSFVPFELNEKRIVAKISSLLEANAMREEHYQKTMELLSGIEAYLVSLSGDFPYNVDFSGMNISSLIKSSGLSVVDDSESDIERLCQYMTMVRDLFGEKVFIFVNMRSFFLVEDIEAFFKTLVAHGFYCMLIDNREYDKIHYENRIVIDSDLCVI